MYIYKTSFAKAKKAGSRWKEVNISRMSLNDIFANYSQIYAVLRNNFFPNDIGFHLNEIKDSYYHSTLTFSQFLLSLGNTALPHMNKIPELVTQQLKYADAFHAGYKIEAIHETASAQSPLPRSEKAYLRLTKSGVNSCKDICFHLPYHYCSEQFVDCRGLSPTNPLQHEGKYRCHNEPKTNHLSKSYQWM